MNRDVPVFPLAQSCQGLCSLPSLEACIPKTVGVLFPTLLVLIGPVTQCPFLVHELTTNRHGPNAIIECRRESGVVREPTSHTLSLPSRYFRGALSLQILPP